MVRNLLIRRIKARLKSEGHDEATIDKAIAAAESESDRPIIDWLRDGGFEALIKFIKEIIALFAV